jgi:hypothetical protein
MSDFFDELAGRYAEMLVRPPGAFTAREFADRLTKERGSSVHVNVAKRILEAEVEAGRLQKRVIMEGHRTSVYWKAG